MRNLVLVACFLFTGQLFAGYDCELETPFDGTYYGKSATKLEASRAAVKACEEKLGAGDFWCNKKKVKCVKVIQKLCTLETPFDGTFEGIAATELEASRTAMKACEKKLGAGDFWCNKKKIKCQDM